MGGRLPWALSGLLVAVTLCSSFSAAYIHKMLESDSVCSYTSKVEHLVLQDREELSAMVITGNEYFQNWTGNHAFNCRFGVSSNINLGVFAVIQRMSLRRGAQGQCIDYIQFRQTKKSYNIVGFNVKLGSSTESWGPKICGKVNALEIDINDASNRNSDKDEDVAVNSFIAHKELEVRIYLGEQPLEANEELSLEIVFTAFHQDCKSNNSIWKYCGGKTCIYEGFFHDEKFNCPYKNCKDENGCHRPGISILDSNRINSPFATKILAGTAAGLMTMFIAFIIFLWFVRHCSTLFCCVHQSRGHPHSSEMQPVPHLDTMATAPPHSLVASGADIRSADKDLPPSYESLFPSK